MKCLYPILVVLFFLISCGSDADKNMETNNDSATVVQLDTTSAENFIQSVVEERQMKNSERTGFTISGKEFFSKGNFRIFNFEESSEDYVLKFSIVLNALEKSTAIDTLNQNLVDVLTLLEQQNGLNFSLYGGNFISTRDLQEDNSEDFVLDAVIALNSSVRGDQTIYLYNGENLLTPTNIVARTNYNYGQYEGEEDGVKEFFEYSEGSNCIIYLRHSEDGPEEPVVEYSHTWKWNPKENCWKGGFIAGDIENPIYLMYTEKQTFLVEKDGGFVVMEQCQSGEPGYFVLTRVTNELSDYYLVDMDGDDVGYNCVVSTCPNPEDTAMQVFEIGRGGETWITGPDTTGEKEIYIDPSYPVAVSIKRDATDKNLFGHKWLGDSYTLWYTIAPENYEYVKCEFNQ